MNKKFKDLTHELTHHLPFTLIATTIGIAIVLFIKFKLNLSVEAQVFEVLHPTHVIASALVSAAIFYKYKKNFFQATLVGIISAILVGSLSDVIFPFTGATLLSMHPHFHLPIIEEPIKILGAALIGSILGIATKMTKFPHIIHVGISVFASMFYILSYAPITNVFQGILSIIVIAIAVVIPCCVSDILFPFFFLGKKIRHCPCKHKH